MISYSSNGFDLLHKGMVALSQVESNGMRIDVDYLNKALKDTDKKIKELDSELLQTDVVKEWRSRYGRRTNLRSLPQLGVVLFDIMKYDPPARTVSGKSWKVDEETLSGLDIPFCKKFIRMRKLEKLHGTYLKGVLREVQDEFIHPFFNLHLVPTFRSSSDHINFQNIPVRIAEIREIIRSCFIARPGRRIIEVDYSGIEVTVAACYHKDPTMIEYINDPELDMHRDMAMECYSLEKGEVSKNIRYCGKNMFVFPQFYGDWYISCARSLWEACEKLDLKLNNGMRLRDHLDSIGITDLGDLDPGERPRKGTFERHIQKVEDRFWNERFKVYNQWKKDWYSEYRERGWFKMKTGFVCQGFMKKNEVINYPVQGAAFHCLLWSLIELTKELKKRKMKTLIVGQIHDSIVADVPENETQDFLDLCHEVMTERIMEEWSWIIIPLRIEAEVTPVDGTWEQKKEWTKQDGVWKEAS